MIKVTIIYLVLFSGIVVFLDYDLLWWELIIGFVGWYVVLSQYLHVKNKRTRSAIQTEIECVLEKDDFNFVDYDESLTLKVKGKTCDALVSLTKNQLKIKLKDKWFIPISRIKGLHKKKVGNINFLCFQLIGENSSKTIDLWLEDSKGLADLV